MTIVRSDHGTSEISIRLVQHLIFGVMCSLQVFISILQILRATVYRAMLLLLHLCLNYIFVSAPSSTIGFGQSRKWIPWPGEGKRNFGRGHATNTSYRCQSLLLPYSEQAPWRCTLRDCFERERNGRAEGTESSKLRETA